MIPSWLEPDPKPSAAVKEGEFVFAAIGLDHGHIYGQCEGLINAGATLKSVYDPDEAKITAFLEKFPGVQVAQSIESILDDDDIQLVTSANIPNERAALGLRVMDAGKDYFTDKAPFTTLEQLGQIQAKIAETGRKYLVYYSERLHVESAVYAGQLIERGALGRVIQVLGMGPHSLNLPNRPDWFFIKEQYGGILCDIGSHQIEQFLHFTGAEDAEVVNARVANFGHPEYPELDDFGEANLRANNGASNYLRVDWFSPTGLSTWGDGRTFILGTEGYLELRKYTDVARESSKDHVYFVNSDKEHHLHVEGRVGFPFFNDLILDCLNRTENAMTQAHALKATELAIRAQRLADKEPETSGQ